MGRKKKVVEEVAIPNEVTTSEVKSSGIQYEGSVQIKLMKGNRTLKTIQKHNIGCGPLFDFLISCLSSSYYSIKCPEFIMLYHNAGEITEGHLGVKSLNAPIFKSSIDTGYQDGVSPYWYIRYKFVIPGGILLGNSSQKVNVLALYNTEYQGTAISDTLNKPSAYVTLSAADSINPEDVTAGTSAIILWELKLSNKE